MFDLQLINLCFLNAVNVPRIIAAIQFALTEAVAKKRKSALVEILPVIILKNPVSDRLYSLQIIILPPTADSQWLRRNVIDCPATS